MSDAEQTNQERVLHEVDAKQRAERLRLREDVELFRQLLAHPGWPRYMAALEQIGNNFNQTLMTPLNNSFESVRTEFAKGALTGIQAAAALPHAKIKEAADLKLTDDGED